MNWLGPLLSDLQSIPLTTLVVVAVGALVLATRMARGSTLSTPHERPGKTLAVRRPGWIARRRARGGIRHPRGRVGVGYTSAVRAVHLDVLALNHHGYIGGAPGSGKTSLLRLLIQGYPGPVIALDTKGSPELADTVWGLPGHVWQIGGPLKLDLLDPEPAILTQQLLEGEIFTDRAIVYRAIAEHAVQRAAWVLRWRDEPREPQRILELLSSPAGLAAVDRDLPDAIMRSTAWQIVLRQGSAADAEQIAAQFGTVWREDISRSSDGRTVTRLREEPRVSASWTLSLPRGSGWLRVAPIGEDDREHIERVVFAFPATPRVPRRLALPAGKTPSVPSADG